MIIIELANIDDAVDYAHILNQSWKDTYKDYVSIEHIDNEFNINNLIQDFSKNLNINDELYMIKLDNKNIGILQLGPPEDKYKSNMLGYGEILSFHIVKDFIGKGYGTIVIEFAEKRLKELGYKHICLWVKKQNERAIKFYLKHGFKKTIYSCEETIDGAPSFVMEKRNV